MSNSATSDAAKVVRMLEQRGFSLFLKNDALVVWPRKRITDDLRAHIRRYRNEIIEIVKDRLFVTRKAAEREGYRVVVQSADLGLCARCRHRDGATCRLLGLHLGASQCHAYQARRGRPPKAEDSPF